MTEYIDAVICHHSLIFAPIEKVYQAITTAAGWNAFFTHDMELDLKKGGRMVWRWKDWGPHNYTVNAEALVLDFAEPTRFSFQWYPVDREHPTTIEFKLESRGDHTLITTTESGYPDTPEGRRMILECACGWGEAITLLKFYLEHGLTYYSRQS